MAVKLSTGLRNALLSGQELRKIFEDSVIKIYTGTAPATADDAATGTLLVPISKASHILAGGEVSTAKEATVLIDDHASGAVNSIVINSVTFTNTNTPDQTHIQIAAALALAINNDPVVGLVVEAHAAGTNTIYVFSRIKGLTFTITTAGGGTPILTDNAVANVDEDTLNFGAAVLGIISKNSDVWSGVAVAPGTAGYFRQVKSDDTGVSSATEPRLQGNVATSGQEMTLSSTTIATGATQTIDAASITMPAS